jgi:hypothetical protein
MGEVVAFERYRLLSLISKAPATAIDSKNSASPPLQPACNRGRVLPPPADKAQLPAGML